MKYIKLFEGAKDKLKFKVGDYVLLTDDNKSYRNVHMDLYEIIKIYKGGKGAAYEVWTAKPYKNFIGYFNDNDIYLAPENILTNYKNNLTKIIAEKNAKSINDLDKYIILKKVWHDSISFSLHLFKVLDYEIKDPILRNKENHIMISLELLFQIDYTDKEIKISDITEKQKTSNKNLMSWRMAIDDILVQMIYKSNNIQDCFNSKEWHFLTSITKYNL